MYPFLFENKSNLDNINNIWTLILFAEDGFAAWLLFISKM